MHSFLFDGECKSDRSEIRFISKSNETKYVDVTSTLIPGTEHNTASVIRVINNITERKVMEDKLSESEERFRATFNSAAIGMCLAHTNGTFFKPNQMFCNLLGYSEEELSHMNFRQITHPDDIQRIFP